MSNFDPSQLLNITVEGANDTRLIPVPEGEYAAIIEDVQMRSGVSQKTQEPWARLDLKCSIEDSQLQATIGRKPSVRGGVMLDLTDQGTLDLGRGRNIGLGRLREACGLNQPGQSFSFTQLVGQYVKVRVGHRADPKDPSLVYDEVKAFAKAS